MMRIGCGLDVHAFVEKCDAHAGRRLILGGVDIPHTHGLLGHSDADAVTHAVCDALLGALALGDIGTHFPDSDDAYRDANSLDLLTQVVHKVGDAHGKIVNVDVSIALQEPKLQNHILTMRKNLAIAMNIDVQQVGVKATTTERLGFVGRREGIAVYAVALVEQSL